MIRRVQAGLFGCALSIWLVLGMGCANYFPLKDGPARAIALTPIINESDLPQIVAPLTRDLRRQLNYSPGWHLTDENQADVILSIRILERSRSIIARDPDDTGRPISYSEDIRASIEWESDLTPPWGSSRSKTIRAHTLVYSDPSLLTAETAAVPQIADQLARQIMAALEWPRSESDS